MQFDTLRISIDTLDSHPDPHKANFCKTELVALLANREITDQIYLENIIRINKAKFLTCFEHA